MSDKITLGMAVYDDFNGAWMTIHAALLYHREIVDEIIVVDNHPNSNHGKKLAEACANAGRNGVKYFPYTDVIGTAAPRNKVFELASNDIVVVCDPHVLFPLGAFNALHRHFSLNEYCLDLIQGPMVYDDHHNQSTHFDLTKWGGEMWGQWAYDEREKEGLPFDIPAQGLGAFASLKSAWLGFNPNFRGFGGEEGYIHEKYRINGRRTICLPDFKWLHRFGRPDGVTYPLSKYDKVRNYCLGYNELGLDLKPVYEHFVAGKHMDSGKGVISEEEWKFLMKGEYPPKDTPGCATCGGSGQPNLKAATLDDMFNIVKKTPRDLDQHADFIKSQAANVEHVTAFVKRREWNVLLAAGRPKTLIVYQAEKDPLIDTVHHLVKAEGDRKNKIENYTTHVAGPGADSLQVNIEPTDLLVIDTIHNAQRLYDELSRHAPKVKKRIMIRGTGAFGEHAEGGNGPGLLPAVRRYIQENPEWTTILHTKEQYGITILSRDKADKKPLPSLWQQGVNAAKAAWRNKANILDYGPLKDSEVQNGRLALCLLCPQHTDGKCAQCGCPIDRKTSYSFEACPLGHWHQESGI